MAYGPFRHDRLVYGSDYVIPAIYPLVSTSLLWLQGLFPWHVKRALDELYTYGPNPLRSRCCSKLCGVAACSNCIAQSLSGVRMICTHHWQPLHYSYSKCSHAIEQAQPDCL
jgi:hypothetical protein